MIIDKHVKARVNILKVTERAPNPAKEGMIIKAGKKKITKILGGRHRNKELLIRRNAQIIGEV